MKNTPVLKIKQNLFLVGDKVISYETHVATVEFFPQALQRRPRIQVKGKYSKTTSKHIWFLAGLLGASVEDSTRKPRFWRFEYGVSCQIENAISPAGSCHVLNAMKAGYPFDAAIAAAVTKLGRRDLRLVHRYVDDLPELQKKIERIAFLQEKGLLDLA